MTVPPDGQQTALPDGKSLETLDGQQTTPKEPPTGDIPPAKNSESVRVIKYYASIYPGENSPIPDEFAQLLVALQKELGIPIWMIIQGGDGRWSEINSGVAEAFFRQKQKLPNHTPIAVLIDSPGGYARYSYQIARILQRRCGAFYAIIPKQAKSAATLLALGATKIFMGEDAELGPLDAQVVDREREERVSALDEVQSIERLFAEALDAVDQSVILLLMRTGKKTETLLAPVMHFVSEMMQPLMEKIDAVHYTQMARALKVAEEYAIRLLKQTDSYDDEMAEKISRRLVENYPEHGFVIDAEEAADIGINIADPSTEAQALMLAMRPFMKQTFIGRLEIKDAESDAIEESSCQED